MDNKMRIVAEEFENTTTGEKVTGVTVMIDGKLRQVFDIMIAKSGYNKSYLEMLQEVLVLGIDGSITGGAGKACSRFAYIKIY